MVNFSQASGYKILNKINENSDSSVFRAIRETDRLNVILKIYKQGNDGAAWDRCKQEYETIGKLKNIDAVIKAYGIETYQKSPVIVLEDFNGEPLKSLSDLQSEADHHPLPLSEFFDLAVRITHGLADIHSARYIHRDINPYNIFYNPDSGQIKIIGFSFSPAQNRDYPVIQKPGSMEGSLPYISPEQTGRMNRPVDYRSDLYSLGIVFYEMLTGHLPFEIDDPLALVHAHIAKIPDPVTALNPAVPPIVSEIIMKLLAKNPEDRYHSAYGLNADLERCLSALTSRPGAETLKNLSFDLGMNDHSGELHLPQKLYGRSEEIAVLMTAFEQASAGSQEFILVAGYAGVGKSALVAEIYKPATERRGCFIQGKFDQYQQSRPYAAFVQAFDQFADLLLTESDTVLLRWKNKIMEAAESNGAVLTEVMPSLEKIIGKQPAVPKLGGQESRNRFNLTFRNFMQAISTAEHPLVIFIDDWQWADLASLELLKLLLIGKKISHLLLIGAYRDNEVDQIHPFMMTINSLKAAGIEMKTIELGNLRFDDVSQFIQESLSGSPADSEALIQMIHEKTQGNAFFMRQFLQNLYEESWLRFDFSTYRWTWDLTRLKSQQITDNVVSLIAGKIKKLTPETAEMLQLAACIGIEFELQTLSLICRASTSTILEQVKQSIALGLVVPLDEYYKLPETAGAARFAFLHDRVQQAAYAQISIKDRQSVHLSIGRLLFTDASESNLDQMLFSIVQHYNKAIPLITNDAERLRIADLNIKAADLAYRAAAFSSAQTYLETAMSLMPPDAWLSRYDIMLKLHSELARVLSLTGDVEQLDRVFQITEKQARTMTDTAQVKIAKIQSLLYNGNYTEAIELGLNFVQSMGIPINRNPSPEEAFRYFNETSEWLTPARIESLLYLHEAPHDIGLILEVASYIGGPAYNSNMYLFLVFVSQITRLCIKQGLAPWATVSLISYAIVLSSAMHDIPKARLLTATIMQLHKERYRLDNPISPFSMIIGGFIMHRYDHLKHTLPVFVEGVQKGLIAGTFPFAGYCAWWHVWHYLFLGEPLSKAEANSLQAEETCEKIQIRRLKDWCLLIHQAILNLQGKSDVPWILKGDVYNEEEKLALAFQLNDLADVFRIYFYTGWLHYLFGCPQEAVDFFQKTESYALYGSGTYLIPLFYLYDTLANAALADQKTADKIPKIIERIKSNLEQFEVWVRFAPMNHQHKKDMMEAEKARLENRYWDAAALYERAIQGARDNEFPHEEALAYELAAGFYLSRGMKDIARLYMTKAYDGYSRWQAWAKVQDMEKRYSQWFIKSPISSKESATEHQEGLHNLDLRSVMKASQVISSQIVLEDLLKKLLEIVIENAGAQRGCLIMEKDGKWIIQAEGSADLKDIETFQKIKIEESGMASLSIIRYVARSHETIVLDDAAQKGLFTDDPYVKENQTKSILCMPLLYRGRLSTIVYLENNLTANAFTPERIEVLELLAGQAGIALENAMLYQQAQQEITVRKVAEEALRESEERFQLFMQHFPGLAYIKNSDIRILFANYGFMTKLNIDPSEIIGKTNHEVFPAEFAKQITNDDLHVLESGQSQENEEYFNDRIWSSYKFTLPQPGRPPLLGGFTLDITERKRAEQELRESEQKYSAVIQQARDGVIIIQDTFLLFVNRAMGEMLGYSPSEMENTAFLSYVAPESRVLIGTRVKARLKGEDVPQVYEAKLLRRDGTIIDAELSASVIQYRGKATDVGIIRDITERKRTEEKLHKSEERFRSLVETTSDWVWEADINGVYTYASPQARELLGYEPEEIIGKTPFDLMSPDEAERIYAVFQDNVANQRPIVRLENIVQHKNRQRIVLETSGKPFFDAEGRLLGYRGIDRDITERKRIEGELQENEARYRALVQTQTDLISRYLPDTTLTFVNDAYCQFYGKTREELIGHSYLFMITPEYREPVRKETEKLAQEYGSVIGEYMNYRHDGRECWIQWAVQCITDENGQVIELQAVGRDITERKRTEEALEKHILALTQPLDSAEGIAFEDLFNLSDMQHLQDLYADAFGVAALITYPDGTPITQPSNFTYLCSEIIRKTSKGVKNCNYSDGMIGRINPSGPTIQSCMSAGLCNAGASITVGGRHVANWLIGQVRNETINEEKVLKYADEIGVEPAVFREAYYKVPVMSQEQFEKAAKVLFAVTSQISMSAYQNVQQARFITDRKRADEELAKYREHLEELVRERTRELEAAQEELLKKERLAVLGQLTATVSHELRNPLGVIRSSAFYLKEKVKDGDEKIRKHLDRIEFQVDLCNWIVEELLEYTRGSTSEMKKENIISWLNNILDDMHGTEHIVITRTLPPNLPKIFFDSAKLSRVMTNLIDNAIHAVRERKEKAEKRKGIYKPQVRVSAARTKGGVEIIITDNGIGMDENTNKRAFEPLYTTKARGTGLGLSIVKKIVEEHSGTIKLESKLHKGTKAIVWLPVRKTLS